MSKDNQVAIFIADFAGKCIREKVMMAEPDVNKICGAFPSDQCYQTFEELMDDYEEHVASRRTYPYDVKEEQDGQPIPESEFRLQHQWFANIPIYEPKKWQDCSIDLYSITEAENRRIIAIPIEPEMKDQIVIVLKNTDDYEAEIKELRNGYSDILRDLEKFKGMKAYAGLNTLTGFETKYIEDAVMTCENKLNVNYDRPVALPVQPAGVKDEMLPCPFCGGKAVLKNYNTSGLWMISCLNNCGVLMAAQCKIPTNDPEIIDMEIKKNVVLNWNKRTSEPSSKEQEGEREIKFAEWCDENYFGIGKGLWAINIGEDDQEDFTTEQLYQLYLKNKNL